MISKVLIALAISVSGKLMSQTQFINEGSIEFERRINVHRQVSDDDQSSDWYKDLVKTQAAFHVSNFTLQFKDNQTIYRLAGELPKVNMWWILGPAKENTIYTDVDKLTRKSVKSVFEQTFIVSDSLREVQWRLSEEKRTIAGFECRKAVGIICDSVYVVAFYTDEIPVTGGPESFSGLPGMILGVAIPRLSVTWFATKVQLTTPSQKDFEITSRGAKTDPMKLQKTLQSSMKDWGKNGQRNIWWVML